MSFNISKPNRTIQAGVILMGGETEILDVAPLDLLNAMSKSFVDTLPLPLPDEMRAQAIDVQFHWLNETGKPARLTAGARIETTAFEDAPILDVVLLGAHLLTYVPNEIEIEFVKEAYDRCSAMLLICGGFMPALAAGVLKGKKAAAPRFMLEGLKKASPETEWLDRRWAMDGKIWTSGALLNGLDMMMAFARSTWPESGFVDMILNTGGYPERSPEYQAGEGFM